MLLHQLQRAHSADAADGARIVAAAQDAHVHKLVVRDAQALDHLRKWNYPVCTHSRQQPAAGRVKRCFVHTEQPLDNLPPGPCADATGLFAQMVNGSRHSY